MKSLFLLAFFLLPLTLFSQSFEEYMDWGIESMKEEDYEKSKLFFLEAQKIRPQDPLPDNYLTILESLVTMGNMDSVAEVEQFLKEQEEEKKVIEENVDNTNPDLQGDFIYQQEQKNLAKQKRPPFSLFLSVPIYLPESGDSNTGILNEGYRIGGYYYPGFLGRVVGLGVSRKKITLPGEFGDFSVSDLYLHLQFRNYIAEELGARTILATSVGVGYTYPDNYREDELQMIPSGQFSIHFSEPLFYHLFDLEDWKPLVVNLNALVRYGDKLNVIEGDLGVVYRMERVDFSVFWDYTYQLNLYDDSFKHWSFNIMAGMNL